MTFKEYWKEIIDKVYNKNETLTGVELIFYRLSILSHETMTDGVETYIERCYEDFENDMLLLDQNGFQNISSKFRKVKTIMVGEKKLEYKVVRNINT